MKPPRPDSLQARALMRGRGERYWAKTEGLPLSLKCMSNGRARYTVGRNEFSVDDGGWLIVNENQPYTIEIASPTPVETFIVWFPRGWAEEVWRSSTTSVARLLAVPCEAGAATGFFERYTPNENAVAPLARMVRAAMQQRELLDASWLEEKLRLLLARMLGVQRNLRCTIARLPPVRAATRDELWRRLNRARDFIHARCDSALTLSDAAQVAAMSPYHFLRTFKTAFGVTPHEWLAACRVERAKFLLARTDLPVTEVCFAIGYEGLGSFSAWFLRHARCSPRAWRQSYGRRAAIRNFREVSPPHVRLSSDSSA
jgi:AraC family transcriptional regulator